MKTDKSIHDIIQLSYCYNIIQISTQDYVNNILIKARVVVLNQIPI